MTGKPDVCAESFPPPWEVLVPLVLTPLAPPSLLVSGAGPNSLYTPTLKDLMERYTRSATWYDALSAELLGVRLDEDDVAGWPPNRLAPRHL